MEESINKGLKLLNLNDSDAAIRKIREVGRIVVTGYDTGLPRDVVESALRKHFASCGEITDVYIPINYLKENTLWKSGYIYFLGEGAVDKALQLKGSDVGGWNVSVTACPFLKHANDSAYVRVEGYDPSLSRDEIKSAMIELFSSYGKIKHVIINRTALVAVDGEDAAVKVPVELDGSFMGGRKLTVRLLSELNKSTVHRRRLRGGPIAGRYYFGKKAKTLAE